jgi:hypothetical protein
MRNKDNNIWSDTSGEVRKPETTGYSNRPDKVVADLEIYQIKLMNLRRPIFIGSLVERQIELMKIIHLKKKVNLLILNPRFLKRPMPFVPVVDIRKKFRLFNRHQVKAAPILKRTQLEIIPTVIS